MATTGLFSKALRYLAGADIDLLNDRIVAARLDLTQGYVVDLAADEFLTDLPADTVAASSVLTGKTLGDGGAYEATDVIYSNVPAGEVIGAILLYKDTGIANSSRLIYYTDNATGLPITGDGDDVTVRWPTPIFSLE